MNVRVVADDTNLALIPAMKRQVMGVVTPEMIIVKEEAFDIGIVQILRAGIPDDIMIAFVHNFIRLQIEQPIPLAFRASNIGLMGVFGPIGICNNIPLGINDAELW